MMMDKSYEFLRLVVDSLTDHIVVIDRFGDIQFVNNSWTVFGDNNSCTIEGGWIGINYIKECYKAAALEDELAICAIKGIEAVIEHSLPEFYLEYPCHSPNIKRWFMMRITPLSINETCYYLISHQNITERKLAEEQVLLLSKTDGLTNIPNRRTFDEFFHDEWRRCARLHKSLSLAIVDIDHFKLLNDCYGHQVGDQCLKQIGQVLQEFVNRTDDLCARYGGEEFALIWGDTSLDKSRLMADKVISRIEALDIPNRASPVTEHLTASIGLATMIPSQSANENELIAIADRLLYKAKEHGRNRVES